MASPPPAATEPSETVRAAVTCGLVLYLGGLLMALAGNTTSGSSAVVRTIKSRIFSPLLTPAWLDLGFDTYLTWGTPADADHALLISRSDATPRDATWRFPDRDIRGVRAARWRRLARAIAAGDASGEAPALLATAAAAGSFTTVKAVDVNLRVVRTPPADRRAAAAPLPEQVYQARVRRVNDDLQLIKAEDTSELAPLARPQPAAGTGPDEAAP